MGMIYGFLNYIQQSFAFIMMLIIIACFFENRTLISIPYLLIIFLSYIIQAVIWMLILINITKNTGGEYALIEITITFLPLTIVASLILSILAMFFRKNAVVLTLIFGGFLSVITALGVYYYTLSHYDEVKLYLKTL